MQAGHHALALCRTGERQGGPLGEGSIGNGSLRCPWLGYDYDPLTGTPPPGFTDAPASYPVAHDGPSLIDIADASLV